jgi:multidrug efflux pump subunit AcrB
LVDDAIVVVENVERNMSERRLCAHKNVMLILKHG